MSYSPTALAQLAEAAFVLGLNELAQEAIDAAYASANGVEPKSVEHILIRIGELVRHEVSKEVPRDQSIILEPTPSSQYKDLSLCAGPDILHRPKKLWIGSIGPTKTFRPDDFAELAQAAVELGLLEAAQTMLVAAFARSNGVLEGDVDEVVDEIREKAIGQEYTPLLTQWQMYLLDLVERD